MMNRLAKGVLSRRTFSSAVTYTAYGNPLSVLNYGNDAPALKALSDNDINIKILASPINPADLNMVEAVYGVKAKLPAVAGKECVALVREVGKSVKSVQVGDWVLPTRQDFGAWREEAVLAESDVLKVPNDIPVAYAATIGVNPCTAYRLLEDFAQLKEGDVIMQNGANSMVGMAVIQLARERGIKTINIIRSDRPDVDQQVRLLENLGGDFCIADSYLGTANFNEIMEEMGPCKLAFNCVGGAVATDMARALAPGGTMVTYGSMSKKPLALPMDLIASKQLQLKGFWISGWMEAHSKAEKESMINAVADLIREKQLTFFYEMHDFDDFNHALKESYEPYRLRKVVLNMDYGNRLAEHDALDQENDYIHFQYPPN